MVDQGGLQLLPETRRRVEIKREGENRPVVMGVILFVAVVAIYVAADFYLASVRDELAGLDNQVTAIEEKRDKNAEEDIRTLTKQLSLVGDLLDNHIFWSNGFDKLEGLTLPQLRFVNMSGDVSREQIDVRVQTAGYANLAKQIAAYLSDGSIVDVTIGNTTTLPSGTVDANLSVKFDLSDFLRE